MRDELLLYYERELTFLRQMGAEFAEKYPKIASRLNLEPDKCEDPHVERLLEAFAFLAARVHLKIDDEFPEITEALLSIVYPHFIRPVPSMTVVEFRTLPDQSADRQGLKIERGIAALFAPRRRSALQVPHLLRHNAAAAQRRRGGMENSRPAEAIHSRRGCRGRPAR